MKILMLKSKIFSEKKASMCLTSEKQSYLVYLMKLFYQEKRIVLTQDSDFGTLIFRDKKPFCGLVYIRPGHVSPNIHIETLEAVLNADFDVNFPFIIVAENTELSVKIRLRQF